MNEIMILQEVADCLRVHPQTVRRMAKRGELASFRVGSDYRVLRSEVLRFIGSPVTAESQHDDGK